jgi:hypothetical protein
MMRTIRDEWKSFIAAGGVPPGALVDTEQAIRHAFYVQTEALLLMLMDMDLLDDDEPEVHMLLTEVRAYLAALEDFRGMSRTLQRLADRDDLGDGPSTIP